MSAFGFSEADPLYEAAGWRGRLPVPPGMKAPVPTGYTGASGRYPHPDESAQWRKRFAGAGYNLALRLESDLVGLDVDAYDGKRGGENFARLKAELGSLPPTLASTSRYEGGEDHFDGSGIRLYRIPPGASLRSDAGAGIDIVRTGHRYVMCWPSVHPNGGLYRWVDEASGEVLGRVPEWDDLPELPAEWFEFLSVPDRKRTVVEPVDSEEFRMFVATATEDLAPGMLDITLERATVRVLDGGCRHDALVAAACRVCRDALAGAFPAARGVAALATWWAEAFNRPGRRPAPGEFEDALSWALGAAKTDRALVERLRDRIDPYGVAPRATEESAP